MPATFAFGSDVVACAEHSRQKVCKSNSLESINLSSQTVSKGRSRAAIPEGSQQDQRLVRDIFICAVSE